MDIMKTIEVSDLYILGLMDRVKAGGDKPSLEELKTLRSFWLDIFAELLDEDYGKLVKFIDPND